MKDQERQALVRSLWLQRPADKRTENDVLPAARQGVAGDDRPASAVSEVVPFPEPLRYCAASTVSDAWWCVPMGCCGVWRVEVGLVNDRMHLGASNVRS
jgi:hypothetical protein